MKYSIMCGSIEYISSWNLERFMRILRVLLGYQYRRSSLRIYGLSVIIFEATRVCLAQQTISTKLAGSLTP